ncbi:hypothetical protein [Streptomyces sp. NPDC006012]|uniref:hypothetical protein n=1 Tax=Streptomyces sp. NPDC006012 TaxID=3364739 RepID=UPI003697F180
MCDVAHVALEGVLPRFPPGHGPTKTTSDSYVHYNTGVTKNEGGVWQIRDLDEDRGAARCQF